MYDAVIVGAGITGLATAYLLQKTGLRVSVLERQGDPGGVIRTETHSDFLFDAGPNSTLAKNEQITDLIDDLDLEQELCFADERASNRYILKGNTLYALPTGPMAFVTNKLLSPQAKMRVLGEIFVPRGNTDGTESIAGFVKRRLGTEFLEYVINPFVAGVYASDPAHLNVKAAFPKLYALEQQYGGLFKGTIKKRLENRNSDAAPMPKARMISFVSGMQAFVSAIVDRIGPVIQTNTSVEAVAQSSDGYTIVTRTKEGITTNIKARRIVFTTPSFTTASLIDGLDHGLGKRLSDVPYAPVAVVFHGFKQKDVSHPLDGFGFLVPAKERRRILGTIWSSSLFPDRAPDDHVALTTFVGGLRQPDLAHLPEPEINRIVLEELTAILGTTGPPVVAKVKFWEHAIPQYVDSYHDLIKAARLFEGRYPGLYLSGNFRGGISVADCIANAYRLRDAVVDGETF